MAQFAVQLDAVGDVPAGAEHADGRAVFNDDAGSQLDPMLLAVGPGRQAIEHAEGRAGAQRFIDRGAHLRPVVRMHVVLHERDRAVEAAGRQPMNGFEVARPGDTAGWDIPRPDADVGRLQRVFDQLAVGEEAGRVISLRHAHATGGVGLSARCGGPTLSYGHYGNPVNTRSGDRSHVIDPMCAPKAF